MPLFPCSAFRLFRVETFQIHRFAYTYGNCVLFLVNGVDKPQGKGTNETAKAKTQAINLKKLSFDLQLKASKALQSIDQKRLFSTTNVINNTKSTKDQTENMENKSEKVNVNKQDLKKRLTPLQYQVTQEAATERPFTGCYNKHYEKGVYQCIVCHQDLFSSDTKYDSGCGWPAFNDVLDKGKVTLHRDASIPGGNILLLIANPDRVRTEVRCSRCNAHMGHVFEDGPQPTRKRYCINSAAIEFISAEELNQRSSTQTTTTTTSPVHTGTPIAQQ